MQTLSKLQNDQKAPSYQLKQIDLTPKKEISVKLEANHDEPTLQKNIIHKIENIIIGGVHNIKHLKKIKRPWNKEEDDLLRKLVETKGAKEWAHISSFFDQRCGKQCRERWHNHLRNGIRKGQWTTEQEWILFLGVQAHGKRWSTISRLLQGRTENTLKNHWNCKMKPKKPFFEKKLESLLRSYSPEQFSHQQLFQIIRQKRNYQQTRNNQVINLLKSTLQQFFEIKEKLLHNSQKIQTPKIFADEQNIKSYDLYSFGSFGKNKHYEEKVYQKTRQKSTQIKRGIFQQQFQDEFVLTPFQLDSNERSDKQHNMDIESSVKESLMVQDIFQQKSDIHNQSCYRDHHFEHGQQKNDFCEKYEVGDFYSPIKQNIFESIDLGQSNKKKKLFEGCD